MGEGCGRDPEALMAEPIYYCADCKTVPATARLCTLCGVRETTFACPHDNPKRVPMLCARCVAVRYGKIGFRWAAPLPEIPPELRWRPPTPPAAAPQPVTASPVVAPRVTPSPRTPPRERASIWATPPVWHDAWRKPQTPARRAFAPLEDGIDDWRTDPPRSLWNKEKETPTRAVIYDFKRLEIRAGA